MDEITRAAIIAFVGLITALFTQVFLRWDQSRRDTKLRLLNDLRIEQTLFESIAYKARQVVMGGIYIDGTKDLSALIDACLFEKVYDESNLVTLCAELEFFGIPAQEYSLSAHTFRENCLKVVTESLVGDGSVDKWRAIDTIINEMKHVSAQTKALSKNINYRFSWF